METGEKAYTKKTDETYLVRLFGFSSISEKV